MASSQGGLPSLSRSANFIFFFFHVHANGKLKLPSRQHPFRARTKQGASCAMVGNRNGSQAGRVQLKLFPLHQYCSYCFRPCFCPCGSGYNRPPNSAGNFDIQTNAHQPLVCFPEKEVDHFCGLRPGSSIFFSWAACLSISTYPTSVNASPIGCVGAV